MQCYFSACFHISIHIPLSQTLAMMTTTIHAITLMPLWMH